MSCSRQMDPGNDSTARGMSCSRQTDPGNDSTARGMSCIRQIDPGNDSTARGMSCSRQIDPGNDNTTGHANPSCYSSTCAGAAIATYLFSCALSPHLAPEGAAIATRRATSPSRTQTESRSGSSRTTDPARQVEGGGAAGKEGGSPIAARFPIRHFPC